MNPESIVTSFHWSQELKKRGCPQDSVFYWNKGMIKWGENND